MLEARLLGGFNVRTGRKPISLPSRPAQSLFAYLIIHAGKAFRREKLAGQLWPDSTEESARAYLRHALWRIRRALQAASAAQYIKADNLTVSFSASTKYWLDVEVLRDAADSDGADNLIRALSCYGGELLPGFYEEWVSLEREHLQSLFEQRAGSLVDQLQQAARWRDVLDWAERWIAFGQKPEAAYRALMAAHAALGDVAKAASTYERCVKALAEFGFEPSAPTKELHEHIRSGVGVGRLEPAAAKAASGKEPSPAGNIPAPLTSFVGRDRELHEIESLLRSTRILTLSGFGGVGKTRLAIQVANRMRSEFKDGACWVELAPVSDPGLVLQAIARSLEIRELPNQGVSEALKQTLVTKNVLLVLDNCEHLVSACASLAEDLAAACPNIRILATSRESLGIPGETQYEVPTLSLPPAERVPLADLLLQYEAVRLFVDRAHAVRAGFELTQQDVPAVQQICQQLDGIPLALELAAARTKVLSVDHIAARLNDRFDLLTQGSRTALPRQQTLRATIDWSYDLLAEDARVLLRRLCVFAGGFTLEAVESVCSEAPLSPQSALDLLARLVDRSLVRVERQGPDERYNMLETIRQYGEDKLRAAGEEIGLRSRHLDFYLQQAEEAEPKLRADDQQGALAGLDAEYGNLRAALEWGMQMDAGRALRLAAALGQFWEVRGYVTEGRMVLETALQHALDAPGEVRANGLYWEGKLASRQGDYARAKAVIEESLNVWRELGNKRGLANSLRILGNVVWVQGDYRLAQTSYEESLVLLQEIGDERGIAAVMSNLGNVALRRGDHAAAREYAEQSVAIFRGLGDKVSLIMALNNLGVVAEEQGDSAAARRFYVESIAISRELGERSFIVFALNGLAHTVYLQGDLENARRYYQESLIISQQTGEKRIIIYCLEGFAKMAARQGNPQRAARLFGAADALRQAIGASLDPAERSELEQDLRGVRGQLGDEVFAASSADGRKMRLEQATAFALENGPS